jgi:hypothetical protein
MNLKLDKLMTKNVHGIIIQIYSCLIVYLFLQLIVIAEEIENKLLDKIRYLQPARSDDLKLSACGQAHSASFMNENIS